MSQCKLCKRELTEEIDCGGDCVFCVADDGDMFAVERAYELLKAELAACKNNKDVAYLERNRLVALLSKLFPSGTKKTAINGWSEDWHGCVYIDFPWGQASWHYHDSQAFLFAHLPQYQGDWNGHTTEEKYAAIDTAMKEQSK